MAMRLKIGAMALQSPMEPYRAGGAALQRRRPTSLSVPKGEWGGKSSQRSTRHCIVMREVKPGVKLVAASHTLLSQQWTKAWLPNWPYLKAAMTWYRCH